MCEIAHIQITHNATAVRGVPIDMRIETIEGRRPQRRWRRADRRAIGGEWWPSAAIAVRDVPDLLQVAS